jgi:Na+-transporting methylmalonyl-CoA/oxaloacetate decarboxylase gamma subunit
MTFLPLFSIPDALGTSGLGFLLVLAVLAVIMFFVKILSKAINGASKKEKAEEPVTEVQTPAPVQTAQIETVIAEEPKKTEAPLPYTPGYVTLDGVKEQDAAVIMAVTSHKTGIDLNRLDFKSIKRLNQNPVLENIAEQDAAAIMAITSDKTGIPLENLIFNSIKLVED